MPDEQWNTGARFTSRQRGLLLLAAVAVIAVAVLVLVLNPPTTASSATPSTVSGGALLRASSTCASDAKTIDIAIATYDAENPGAKAPTTSAQWESLLLSGQTPGGPYLAAWPTSPYYAIRVAGQSAFVTSDNSVGGDVAAPVEPEPGDVLVISTANDSSGVENSYDATLYPTEACLHLAPGS